MKLFLLFSLLFSNLSFAADHQCTCSKQCSIQCETGDKSQCDCSECDCHHGGDCSH